MGHDTQKICQWSLKGKKEKNLVKIVAVLQEIHKSYNKYGSLPWKLPEVYLRKCCSLWITVRGWKEGFLNQQEVVTPDVMSVSHWLFLGAVSVSTFCVLLRGSAQLGAVSWAHRIFLADVRAHKQMQNSFYAKLVP